MVEEPVEQFTPEELEIVELPQRETMGLLDIFIVFGNKNHFHKH